MVGLGLTFEEHMYTVHLDVISKAHHTVVDGTPVVTLVKVQVLLILYSKLIVVKVVSYVLVNISTLEATSSKSSPGKHQTDLHAYCTEFVVNE